MVIIHPFFVSDYVLVNILIKEVKYDSFFSLLHNVNHPLGFLLCPKGQFIFIKIFKTFTQLCLQYRLQFDLNNM